ncbi:hypothetical protein BH18THE2_BH18THE2_27130 [soil metagenome]
MTRIFIPRFENYEYPSDEDYEHFNDCGTRKNGKLFECKQCKYVWDHWYGTSTSFNNNNK